jgi:hypothetical protein
MTRTHEAFGDLLDGPGGAQRLHHINGRDLLVAAEDRARAVGDDGLATELAWERGIMDLWVTRLLDGTIFRQSDRGDYEAYYGITPSTREYAFLRADETGNLALRCHHLAYARASGPASGKEWRDVSRRLAYALQALCDEVVRSLSPGDRGTGAIPLVEALPAMIGLIANKSLFRPDEQRTVVAWLMAVAEALRGHPWHEGEPDRVHRWPFEVLRFLPRIDANLVDIEQRERALVLVHEAYLVYQLDPFADAFTIATAETEGELRAHFGESNARREVANRTMQALTQKAEVFMAGGSGLAAAATYHDAAKAADQLLAELSPEDRRDIPRRLRSLTRQSIEKALASNEFKRVSMSVGLPGCNFSGEDADGTAMNLITFVRVWINTVEAAGNTRGADGDAPSLLELIPAMTTDGEMITADAVTDQQIAAHRETQHLASHGTLLGEVVRATLVEAAKKQGLTAEHVIQAFPAIPLRDDQRTVLARGIEQFLQQDAISAVFILAPLVESATRAVLESRGIDTSKFKPLGDGAARTEYVTLGALLRRRNEAEAEAVRRALGEPLRDMLLATTVDHAGPNLRNRVAHGMAGTVDCSMTHAALLLSLFIRLADVGADTDETTNGGPASADPVKPESTSI